MAVVGFKYKDGEIVCYDCFVDYEEEHDDAKVEGLITDREAQYQPYCCDKCGRLIS